MKNVQSIWFSSLGMIGQIGIVVGEDEVTGKRKAYIGMGYGINPQTDERIVLQNGAKFPAEIAARIAKWMNEETTVQSETKDEDTKP